MGQHWGFALEGIRSRWIKWMSRGYNRRLGHSMGSGIQHRFLRIDCSDAEFGGASFLAPLFSMGVDLGNRAVRYGLLNSTRTEVT